MICGTRHPNPYVLLRCEKEEQHEGPHSSSTVAINEYVEWSTEKYELQDALADLAKLRS